MCDDKFIDANKRTISITKRHLLVMMMFVECCILTGCVQNVNTTIDQVEVTTCKKSSACAEHKDYEVNVSPYLLKELTWEMGSGKPKPIDFFDPKAVGTTEGLSEEEIEKFTILTPITDEMLFNRGKYVVKIQCNGIIIEGHISIVDTVPPVIEAPKQMEYEINSNILYKKDVIVSDNSNERPELLVDSSGVKTNIAGTYTVYYSAIDSSGNIGKASTEIIIAKGHEPTKTEVDQLADELLRSILSDNMTQLEQIRVIFDWCYNNIRYTSDSDKSSILQGAYDGIYFRAGDCYTFYATAAYMMDRCGIENLAVSRKGENATHYWSLVKVDGEWYHFDCSPHKGGFKCFMQTDEQVREYARECEREETYFEFDEKEMPERAKKEIFDGKNNVILKELNVDAPMTDMKKDNEGLIFTISLAGDCSLGKLSVHGYEGTFDEMYDRYGADYFFKNVKYIFAADDMTLVNFEGVLTESNEIVEKQYNIKGKPEYIQILNEADIDAVSFGNNHRIDYGERGIVDTIVAFNSINMPFAFDDNLGIYEAENGIKVGFVSVNEVYDEKKVEDYLEQGIARLKEMKVNLILACCHWGEEGHHYPEAYQTELGHKCIDWGADLVVGCHPHVLQGIEYYDGKYIIYSLGNFCFGGNRNPKNKDSMIVQAKFSVKNGLPEEEAQLTVIPCTISSVTEKNDYCPTVVTGERKSQIIKKLNEYSKSYGVSVSEDGVLGHEEILSK